MADEEPKEEIVTINGVSEVEFNSWKHNPVTKTYIQFLKDMSQDAKEAATLAWLGGHNEKAFTDEARGMANTYALAARPKFGVVVEFYQRRDETLKQEAQANDDEN